MGDHNIHTNADQQKRMKFIAFLLDDLEALQQLLDEGKIEQGITRIGAEQEFCLVDKVWRPATNSVDILDSIQDEHFTTELAKYNLEINLDPFELKANAFQLLENQLRVLLEKAQQTAEEKGSKIILTGILPSITQQELAIDFMTPNPRYYELNDRLKSLKNADFNLHLTGVDELSITHDNIMFEACCTSFQMHLQIEPDDFIAAYNWAQAISGPVLGICTNSPLLLGRALWNETRIALFRQSIDTRSLAGSVSGKEARVHFGDDWAKDSIVSLYQHEVSRYRKILTKEIEESSMQELKTGKIPKLHALNLHCGTIYPWNRPCYGIGGGKAHLRIENRYIPSGPTVLDEMANFAFWVGLMVGRPSEMDDMPSVMDFRDAKGNFIKAARNGSETMMRWMGKDIPLKELIIKELLPIARKGLEKVNINPSDIDKYLEVIKKRAKGQTASKWMLSSYEHLKKTNKMDEALRMLTKSIYDHQQSDLPVHQWPLAEPDDEVNSNASKVGHIMSNKLITADPEDMATLTLKIMQWNEIHHLPVVNHQDELVGLLTWSHMGEYREKVAHMKEFVQVDQIMIKKVETAQPSMLISDAITFMNAKEIGCLPVVEGKRLVGIITKKDLVDFQ